MADARPTDLELQVLSVLWDRGGSTVREVMRELPDGKRRAYTTVLTILQMMEKKGLVSHTRKGLTYVYHPQVNRDEIVTPVIQTLLKNVFGGDPSAIVQSLLDCGDVDADQLREIRRVINAAARQAREEDRP
jgi:BlaI family penicillinase repressor